MHIDDLREICITKKGVTEEFPFDADILVFKVMGKAFALTSLSNPSTVNLKCDPELAIELRERYNGVNPGYHMNKKHWNTVELDGDYSDKQLSAWIQHSYEMVIKGMTKKLQQELNNL